MASESRLWSTPEWVDKSGEPCLTSTKAGVSNMREEYLRALRRLTLHEELAATKKMSR